MKKKLLSILLVFGLLAVSMVPMSPIAEVANTVTYNAAAQSADQVAATTEDGVSLTYGLLFPGEAGRGGGTVKVEAPDDGVYWLYWGSDATTDLANYNYISAVKVENGVGVLELNKYMLIPEGATHLILKNSEKTAVLAVEVPEANRYDAAVLGEMEYSFGMVSDLHVTNDGSSVNIRCIQNAYRRFLQLSAADGSDFKFIGDTGDTVNYAYKESYAAYNNALNEKVYGAYYNNEALGTSFESAEAMREAIPYLASPGNHDAQWGFVKYAVENYDSITTEEKKVIFEDLFSSEEYNSIFGTEGEFTDYLYHSYAIPGTNDYVFRISTYACLTIENMTKAVNALKDLAKTATGKIYVYQHITVFSEAGDLYEVANTDIPCDTVWGEGGDTAARQAVQKIWADGISEVQNVIVFNGHSHADWNYNLYDSNYIASDGNGDYARQIYVASTATAPTKEYSDLVDIYGKTGMFAIKYHNVYDDAIISYALDATYLEDPSIPKRQPVACLYIPYEDTDVENVTYTAKNEITAGPTEGAAGIDVTVTTTDVNGNVVADAVTYRVVDNDYNAVDSAVAYVADGKLYFTDSAASGKYKVIATAGNQTVVFNVGYYSVYIESITLKTCYGVQGGTYTIDNDAHTITIDMNGYNFPRLTGYVTSAGEVSLIDTTKGVDDGKLRQLIGGYANCYVDNGDIITVSNEAGTQSVDYKVIVNYPYNTIDRKILDKGTGTKEDPFLIENADDVAYFFKKSAGGDAAPCHWSGLYFLQTNDIVYTGDMMGSSPQYHFAGTYNGGGHTLTVNQTASKVTTGFAQELFGTIENLTLAGNITTTSATICAVAYDSRSTAVVRNVHISADITSSQNSFIIGSMYYAGAEYKNVLFTGALGGTGTHGAFWGAGHNAFKSQIYVKDTSAFTAGYTATVTAVTEAQLTSGEITYKLDTYAKNNGLVRWGQKLGTDALPILGGADRVYYFDENGDDAKEYTNTVCLETPVADIATGTEVALGTKLHLTADEGTTVYYTIDGSEPTNENGKQYNGFISLVSRLGKDGTITVKAKAYKEGFAPSETATFQYTVDGVWRTWLDFETEKNYTHNDENAVIEYVDGGRLGQSYKFSQLNGKSIYIPVTRDSAMENGDDAYVVFYIKAPKGEKSGLNFLQLRINVRNDEGKNSLYTLTGVAADRNYKFYNLKTNKLEDKSLNWAGAIDCANIEGFVMLPRSIFKVNPGYADLGTIDFKTITQFEVGFWSDGYPQTEITLDEVGVTNDLDSYLYYMLGETKEPVANKASGEVSIGTEIALSAEEAAKIYYTLDGTEPTENSAVYTAPIVLDKADMNVTLKAVAVIDGFNASEVVTYNYTTSLYTVFAGFEENESVMVPESAENNNATTVEGAFGNALNIDRFKHGSDFDIRRETSLTNIAGYDKEKQALVMWVSLPEAPNGAANWGAVKLVMNHHQYASWGDPYAFGANKELTLIATDGTVSTLKTNSSQVICMPSGFEGWIVAPVADFELMAGWAASYELDASLVRTVRFYNSTGYEISGWTIDEVGFTGNKDYFIENAPSGTLPEVVVKGDANGDGEIDIRDLMVMEDYRDGKTVEINLKNSDLNGDGVIDTKDVIKFRRYRLGIIDSL